MPAHGRISLSGFYAVRPHDNHDAQACFRVITREAQAGLVRQDLSVTYDCNLQSRPRLLSADGGLIILKSLRDAEEVFMADILMPMNGKVIAVNVQVGDNVSEDDELVIIEAMKMELPVVATEGGAVKEIKATVGESYQVGDVLVVLG